MNANYTLNDAQHLLNMIISVKDLINGYGGINSPTLPYIIPSAVTSLNAVSLSLEDFVKYLYAKVTTNPWDPNSELAQALYAAVQTTYT